MNEAIQLANAFGRWLYGHLWQMSIELAVLAVVVFAAIALLRIRSAALRHLFWCLLLAKPVATFLIASPVSLYWFLNPPTEAIVQARPAAIQEVLAPERPDPMPRRYAAEPRPTTVGRPVEPRVPLDRFGLLAAAWVLGSVVLCLRLVFGFAYVSFLRRTPVPVPGGVLRDLVDRTSTRLGVRSPVGIGLSPVSHGPILAGVLRPTILLPERVTDELSNDQMRSIIAHELAHARRRDNLVLLVQRLAEMLLFFHPVVWLCGKMMRREAEAACDDVVLRHIADSRAYADSLTRIAEMRLGITQRLLVNTFAAAETHFTRRLRRILEGRMTVRITFASACVLILIGCLGLPRVAARKPVVKESPAMSSHPESALLDFEPVFDPAKKEFGNGLTIILNHLGDPVDYTTLMGDLGLAFILQASETASVIDGAPDAGWWPLAPECLPTLLSHFEPVIGRRIQVHRTDLDHYKRDPVAAYRQSFE